MFHFTVTLNFDLLTLKYNAFIAVPECTDAVSLVEKNLARYRVDKKLGKHVHTRTDGPTHMTNKMPPTTLYVLRRHKTDFTACNVKAKCFEENTKQENYMARQPAITGSDMLMCTAIKLAIYTGLIYIICRSAGSIRDICE